MLMQDVLATASGAIVGLVLGLVGGGGSILAVPLLVYIVGVSSPHVAIGTSAIAVALSAATNLVGHARMGHVKWRCALVFAAAGSVGAAIGSTLGKNFDGDKILLLFGVLMIVVAALMHLRRNPDGDPFIQLTTSNAKTLLPNLVFYGVGAGLLSGFFGIGGGFLIVPGIIAATGMPLVFAIGSSLVCIAIFGLTTASNYALSGLIDWVLVFWFVVGGIFGGFVGQWAVSYLTDKENLLSHAFSTIVAAVGAYIVWQGFAA